MGVATGTFQLPNGSPVANGVYQWKLNQDAIGPNSTSVCDVPVLFGGNLDSNGNMTATFIFNDQLSTTSGLTTIYQLTVKDNHGGQVWNESYYLTGTAANVNIIPPASGGAIPGGVSTNQLISINGVSVLGPNFNNTTPAATAGFTNVLWQLSAGQVSAQVQSGVTISTSAVAAFYGAGFIPPFYGANLNNSNDLGVATNAVYVFKFVPEVSWIIRTGSYLWYQTVGGDGFFGFGLYQAVASCAALGTLSYDINSSGGPNTAVTAALSSPLTLQAGTPYYFGQSTSHTGLIQTMFGINTVSGEGINLMFQIINANDGGSFPSAAVAAQTMAAGVMPSFLGALTALSTTAQANIGIAAVKWMP